MSLLDEILRKLDTLSPEALIALEQERLKEAAKWLPNPGAQTDAYLSLADVLLYGGAGGGGKSDLGLGLAFTKHRRALILRRRYANLSGLTERAIKINGSKQGFNGSPPPLLRTDDGRYIQFGANQHLGDEQDWQGIPFDLKYFDEATQFLEQQVRFHLGWMRLSDEVLDKNQRVRAVLGSNPPVDADGDWLIGMFRPWLDLTHPKPAKPGELRWFVTAEDGTDLEVDTNDLSRMPNGAYVHKAMANREGKPLGAKSRSFIPAKLADNPFLVNTDYGSQLDALPEPLRSAIRDGNFMAARSDAKFQVIPTDWIIQAQARWKEDGWKQFEQTAMALDPAGGGKDSEELVWRHGSWFSNPVSAKGEITAGSKSAAAAIFLNRRDNAPVILDVGGGYAGAIINRLEDNTVPFISFNGAGASTAKTLDSRLPFANKRAEAWYRLREALDPNRKEGSDIALPPDPELRADLSAPCLDTSALERRGVIQIESKDNLRERLGRSPGKGDAVVMCWSGGNEAVRRSLGGTNGRYVRPEVKVGYANLKKRRR